MNRPLVKICGITSQENADICRAADFLGFIFHAASPRAATPEAAAAIDTGTAARVGVFTTQSADEVRGILRTARLDFAQLHGGQNEEFCQAVGPERVIKVVWPERYDSVEALNAELKRFAPHCRMFLLDAGTSGGGHGRGIAAEALSGVYVPKPWLLAGGLTPDNVAEAIRNTESPACAARVNSSTGRNHGPTISGSEHTDTPQNDAAQDRAFRNARAAGADRHFAVSGVDLNSGVENAPGRKDPGKVRRAFLALIPCGTQG